MCAYRSLSLLWSARDRDDLFPVQLCSRSNEDGSERDDGEFCPGGAHSSLPNDAGLSLDLLSPPLQGLGGSTR